MTRLVLLILVSVSVVTPLSGQQAEATSPHGLLSEALDCSNCHDGRRWRPSLPVLDFDHDAASLQLDGAHEEIACETCHLDLRWNLPDVDGQICGSCHLDIHQGAFGGECLACHNTVTFREVPELEAHARTSFPLTGAHAQLQCESCHGDFQAVNASRLEQGCIACHLDDYQAAPFIDHEAQGFPMDCLACHTDVAWSVGTRLDHGALSGGFSLVGRHAQLDCLGCHTPPPGNDLVFPVPSRPDDCVSCHSDDHARQHDPSFSMDCAACHNADTWSGATFDHDALFFPIYSGAHAEEWSSCQTCHAVPNDHEVFTCIVCHAHDPANAARNHSEVVGFIYESNACLSCHPTGSG